jgi:succinate-semialdehyde dehydrogenase/glutarate-semialdehyde dehydrogenase
MSLISVNPATGQVIQQYEAQGEAKWGAVVEAAWRAFLQWRRKELSQRAQSLQDLAAVLRKRRRDMADLATMEMGKPIGESLVEVDKCAEFLDVLAEYGADALADLPAPRARGESFVAFEPLGVILAVMPWNFPYWQVFRFAGPALLAGNATLLKHATNVTGCALAMQQAVADAGLNPDLFGVLKLPGEEVLNVLAHPAVRGAALTGSAAAGSRLAEAAGRNIKKTVLELGGSDPLLVLEDADLDACAKSAASYRLRNAGQTCLAPKRMIALKSVAAEFEEKLAREFASFRLGDPTDASTGVGPLAREDLRERVRRQVRRSLDCGARLVYGGQDQSGPGFYFQPTILANCGPGMPAWDEEIFGPVAALATAESEEHAVRLANDTHFGLASSIWTRDIERGQRLGREIEAGSVTINGPSGSDFHLPFGGVKKSGYGREMAEIGLREFVNIKSIRVFNT